MKYRIIAKLKSGKDVIGYRLGLEGGKQLDLPKIVHSLASQEEITNAKFNRCDSLEQLDLSSFDTTSVVELTNIFDGCKTDEIQGIDKLINNLNKLDLYL